MTLMNMNADYYLRLLQELNSILTKMMPEHLTNKQQKDWNINPVTILMHFERHLKGLQHKWIIVVPADVSFMANVMQKLNVKGRSQAVVELNKPGELKI